VGANLEFGSYSGEAAPPSFPAIEGDLSLTGFENEPQGKLVGTVDLLFEGENAASWRLVGSYELPVVRVTTWRHP
jgi:hypothetical protein